MWQAVLLAAGHSTRTYPLTSTRPKPLIPLLGRPLLEHLLSQLEGLVDETILVVGYRADAIRERLGSRFRTLPLRYLVQREQRGTAHALLEATSLIEDRCLVLNGDDLYHRHDLRALMQHPTAILVTPVPDPQNRAVVTIDGERIVDIVEKPADAPPHSLASVGGYALERRWLDRLANVTPSPRGELELPDFIRMLVQESVVAYHRIERHWLPLTYAWDVLRATLFLMEKEERARDFGVKIPTAQELRGRQDLRLENGVSDVSIEGPVLIGSGVVVGSGCRITGPAVIGDGCRLGDDVQLDRSVLFPNVEISDRAVVSYSVLGERVRVGPRARLRSDPPVGRPVEVHLQNKRIPASLDRLGLIAGDEAEVPADNDVPAATLLEAAGIWRPAG